MKASVAWEWEVNLCVSRCCCCDMMWYIAPAPAHTHAHTEVVLLALCFDLVVKPNKTLLPYWNIYKYLCHELTLSIYTECKLLLFIIFYVIVDLCFM